MFVLWAVSLNYKVVYDRGSASVCVSKLRGQRCETTASACEVWHTLIKQLRALARSELKMRDSDSRRFLEIHSL